MSSDTYRTKIIHKKNYNFAKDSQDLVRWYLENKRDLPWRQSQDAYRIWISEVMLQQTTVQAVLPYFDRFMKRFPKLKDLAGSPLEDVIEHWAGLGYYSRARNLHKSALKLQESGFPKSFADLLDYPGFGPYTSRAVSSLAFEEKVGVLDGNVIRILCRKYGLNLKWWEGPSRNILQDMADSLAQIEKPSQLNQAMMELGATVCTPKNPTCFMCPWNKTCVAFKEGSIAKLPLQKPRAELQNWIWRVQILNKKNTLGLIQNTQAPFLKGQWIFPGEFIQTKSKPKKYDVNHSITKYNIYVQIEKQHSKSKLSIRKEELKKIKWFATKDLKKINPSSLLQKILKKGIEI